MKTRLSLSLCLSHPVMVHSKRGFQGQGEFHLLVKNNAEVIKHSESLM